MSAHSRARVPSRRLFTVDDPLAQSCETSTLLPAGKKDKRYIGGGLGYKRGDATGWLSRKKAARPSWRLVVAKNENHRIKTSEMAAMT